MFIIVDCYQLCLWCLQATKYALSSLKSVSVYLAVPLYQIWFDNVGLWVIWDSHLNSLNGEDMH